MQKFTFYLLITGIALVLYSCATSIPRSDSAHQAWAEKKWNTVHLDEGRSLYVTNCSGCHSLHSPLEHSQTEWTKLFDEMASKAHMTPSDSVSVLAYLVTFSKDTDMK